jgi:hypothetical protein
VISIVNKSGFSTRLYYISIDISRNSKGYLSGISYYSYNTRISYSFFISLNTIVSIDSLSFNNNNILLKLVFKT